MFLSAVFISPEYTMKLYFLYVSDGQHLVYKSYVPDNTFLYWSAFMGTFNK